MTKEIRRLYRARTESRLAGVCGGIGLFFNIDPVFVRLGWVAVTLMTGIAPGIIAYIVAWIIVPQEPATVREAEVVRQPNEGTV